MQVNIATAQDSAVSTFYISDTRTQFSVNLPPDSDDVNFYLEAPDWYSYTAFGFGSSMADSLMIVMYPSRDFTSTHSPVDPRSRHPFILTGTPV